MADSTGLALVAQFAQVVIAVIAVAIALLAWRTSTETLRTSFRPVLRPVPLGSEGQGISGDALKVKNIGRGPAVAVMLFDAADDSVAIGDVDVVEPLLPPTGPGGEAERVGNVKLWIRHPNRLEDEHRYRVVYQDLEGTWHESTFSIDGQKFVVRFLGPSRWWHWRRIPAAAVARGQVSVREIEG